MSQGCCTSWCIRSIPIATFSSASCFPTQPNACEKLRYEALADPSLAKAPFKIAIALDKEAGILTIEDNGIGMTREDLAESLGTIARSGTRAFLDRIGAKPEQGVESEGDEAGPSVATGPKVDLIGQFGIGFYSAFMVADRVEVFSRRAGSSEPSSGVRMGKAHSQ